MATGRSNKLVELAPLRRHRGRDCPASREVGGDGSEHEEIKDRDAFSGISAKIVGLKSRQRAGANSQPLLSIDWFLSAFLVSLWHYWTPSVIF